MEPQQGKDEWLITQELARAMGYPMHYDNAAQIMDDVTDLHVACLLCCTSTASEEMSFT